MGAEYFVKNKTTMTMISKNTISKDCKINKINNPYSIWVIDNFLTEGILDKIHQHWPSSNDLRWISGYKTINGKKNILEEGLLAISKISDIPTPIQSIFNFFHTDEFTHYVQALTCHKQLVSDTSMRWSGLRIMLPGSSQKIHSDARIHPENKLRKEITCLLYLNKEYQKTKDTGCLEIWDDSMTNCVHEIEPLNNRLVLFVNNDKAYHGVPFVKTERKAITWSILTKQAATSTRSKALFVSRPQDDKKIGQLGLERAYIKDKVIK
jgi:hypothetical protein